MDGRRLGAHLVRSVVAVASAAVLVVTGWSWSVYDRVSSDMVTSNVLAGRPAPPAGPDGLDEPVTALLVGIDSRTDASGNPLPPEVLSQLRAGEDEGQFNTDTLILMHIPAGDTAAASAVSIPRDSFVELAGDLGRHKINSAYRRGMVAAEDNPEIAAVAGPARERALREAGRAALVATVEDLTGARIDHYAELNLVGFVEVTDAVGGVPVCLAAPVREPRSGVDLPAGQQLLNGSDALAFVRQRHDLADGDLDRVARQQAFLAGLARSALSSGALSDPVRLDALVSAVTRHVVLDDGWDLDALAAQMRRATGGDIAFRTIPTGSPALDTPVDGVAVEVDPEAVRAFVGEVLDPVQRERLTSPLPTAPPTAEPASAAPPPSEPITAATVPCVD